ncbi:ABC transporter permease [Amphibacillus sp. MSJ-3]|uniref:ABC transporter permease n=1 Tax=Amphibacillus sp. MSJ-3 TaxID=2841505 RepID=UPI001C0F328B|nr:ABC transporter permease [Amphibacillus sp. MSJ-3]MBU5594554.1 ABC transporter permease [Amphibacillus sp. MSJ-3]
MITILKVEWVKQKKWLILFPLLLGPILIFLFMFVMNEYNLQNGRPFTQSLHILQEFLLLTNSYLVLIVIVMFSSFIVDIEHQSLMWGRLLITPFQKWKFFLAKVIYVFILVQLFGLLTWLAVSSLGLLYGDGYLWDFFLPSLYLPFLFSLPYIIVQTLFAMIFDNAYVSICIGLGVLLIHQALPFYFLPWSSMNPTLFVLTENDFFLLVHVVILTIGYGIGSVFVYHRQTFSLGGLN